VLCISNFNTYDEITSKIYEKCKKYNSNLKLVMQSDHHLNHASLAYYNSGFDESLVVVADGSGSTIK
jgi:predicted NodU family carbamoyl transferase